MNPHVSALGPVGNPESEPAPSRQHPRRWWILGALSLSLMVLGLDTTVLTVALPVLTQKLGATTTDLQWIMDSYILVLAAFLLPAGSLGDRIGRKRVLVTGLTIFLVGSLLCARATSPGALIGFRAFMGLGGALTLPLTLSVLPAIFNDEERPRALAVWSITSGVSTSLGPIVGGWLLDHFSWGSIFLFNVPFIVTALAAVIWLVPNSRDRRRRGGDPLGVLLSMTGLISLVYAIIEQPSLGWDRVTVGALTAGVVLLVLMFAWEARYRHPMLNVRLFASPRFTWATIGIALIGMVAVGTTFLITQLLQDVEGYSPLGAGLRMLPDVAGMVVGSQVVSRLLPRIGNKLTMAGGYALDAVGLALLGTTSVTTGYAFLALCLALIGAGLGAAMAPGLDSIMGAMPEGEFGAGSALANTFRQVGGAIGVALLGDVYLNRYKGVLRLPDSLPAQVVRAARQSVGAANSAAGRLPPAIGTRMRGQAHAAFVSGFDLTLLIAAGVALAAVALVAALLPARKPVASGRSRA
jgi:EmrB/QacA subfamily drug resistance transporter